MQGVSALGWRAQGHDPNDWVSLNQLFNGNQKSLMQTNLGRKLKKDGKIERRPMKTKDGRQFPMNAIQWKYVHLIKEPLQRYSVPERDPCLRKHVVQEIRWALLLLLRALEELPLSPA
jgi:hypothetical protein